MNRKAKKWASNWKLKSFDFDLKQRFSKNAQTYGPQWAQQKGAELQQKEQELSYAQQAILRQLQDESGKEMDSLVKDVKKFIKDYGKEKGYNYIYGTGDAKNCFIR
ncbi:OmpH family outer membrane protein [Flavobacterium piscinae]|uniref:OmpH family outer membrane protein n=1 Tax=Flavobacterium piscinae TaxID=2506424 RepID=UPI002AAACFB1|nr:OmpH family outer membrane protein [Flavobacterium piscinae]